MNSHLHQNWNLKYMHILSILYRIFYQLTPYPIGVGPTPWENTFTISLYSILERQLWAVSIYCFLTWDFFFFFIFFFFSISHCRFPKWFVNRKGSPNVLCVFYWAVMRKPRNQILWHGKKPGRNGKLKSLFESGAKGGNVLISSGLGGCTKEELVHLGSELTVLICSTSKSQNNHASLPPSHLGLFP